MFLPYCVDKETEIWKGCILYPKSFSDRGDIQTPIFLTLGSILRAITLSLRIFFVECLQVKLWAVTETLQQTNTQVFIQTLDLNAISYCRETCVVMRGDQSFLITQRKKHYCYCKHWDWWDFCYDYLNCLQPVESSLTCQGRTTLEKHVELVLPVKSSLGGLFCFVRSSGTTPASWRQG